MNNLPSTTNFRAIQLMPLISDLLSTDEATTSKLLRPNNTVKPYHDVDTYLETHFRLLWADLIEPLRQSIGVFCRGSQQVPPINQDFFFYPNVKFIQKSDNDRRFTDELQLQFQPIPCSDLVNDKRLKYGSLVFLWKASHQLIILATVTQCDPEQLKRGRLMLRIESKSKNYQNFTAMSYTMLESKKVFYEPYRVVMRTFQQFHDSSFPLKEHLLGWSKEAGVPNYLTRNYSVPYRVNTPSGIPFTIRDVFNINNWPSAEDLGVNPSQRIALHAAITSRVALIQGPPGTGKSFIARKIIDTLIANQHLWRNRRQPIVVICLTNQALDQFLEGVLQITKRLIRFGRQSQSTALQNYTFSSIKEKISSKRTTDFELCCSVDVIGFTTTGAVGRRDLLELLNPVIGIIISSKTIFII